MGWIAHRKWIETKQLPDTAGPGNMLGCCLTSFHFLWAILRPQAVVENASSSQKLNLFPDPETDSSGRKTLSLCPCGDISAGRSCCSILMGGPRLLALLPLLLLPSSAAIIGPVGKVGLEVHAVACKLRDAAVLAGLVLF